MRTLEWSQPVLMYNPLSRSAAAWEFTEPVIEHPFAASRQGVERSDGRLPLHAGFV